MSSCDDDDDDDIFYDARETLSTPAAPSIPPDTPKENLPTPLNPSLTETTPTAESLRTLRTRTMPSTRPPRRESLFEERMRGLRMAEQRVTARLDSETDITVPEPKIEERPPSPIVEETEPDVEEEEESEEEEEEEESVEEGREHGEFDRASVDDNPIDKPTESEEGEFVVRNLDTGEVWNVETTELDPHEGLDPITMRTNKIEQRRSGAHQTQTELDSDDDSDHSSKKRGWKLFGRGKKEKEDEEHEDEDHADDLVQKVGHHKVRKRELVGLYFVQQLDDHTPKPVWVLKFSVAGEYLATAGGDGIIRIWEVYNPRPVPSENESDLTHRRQPSNESKEALTAPIVHAEPFRVFEKDGHEGDVLDIVWSRNNFLLSASADRTVRLWHTSADEPISVFRHTDFVTAIAFHPKDDRFFLSGSLDGRLRIWNILDEKVVTWVEVKGLITTAAFSLDGKMVLAGTYAGMCTLYDASDGLQFITEIPVRSTRGRNARESKITGIEPVPSTSQVLITSNDSRIRLYNIQHDTSLHYKYRGHVNERGQIKAHCSPDGQFVICGSEDNRVYIWKSESDYVPSINPRWTSFRKDRSASYEYFSPTAEKEVVTDAIFAPVETVARLRGDDAKTEDPGYIIATASLDGVVKLFAKGL